MNNDIHFETKQKIKTLSFCFPQNEQIYRGKANHTNCGVFYAGTSAPLIGGKSLRANAFTQTSDSPDGCPGSLTLTAPNAKDVVKVILL
jgi:hypothetical protein